MGMGRPSFIGRALELLADASAALDDVRASGPALAELGRVQRLINDATRWAERAEEQPRRPTKAAPCA
jgi:hypothetical protein